MTATIGISYGFHDSACALVAEGKLLCAITEESFTRIKHDNNFPNLALRHLLQIVSNYQLTLTNIVFFEDPTLKEHRNRLLFNQTKIQFSKFVIKSQIIEFLSHFITTTKIQVSFKSHHLSHISGSFGLSGFPNAIGLVVDAVGEYECISIWKCLKPSFTEPANYSKLYSENIPYSLGLMYSMFTKYIGFEVNEGEYKLMGLSAYGQQNKKLFEFLESWYSRKINPNYFGDLYESIPSDSLELLLGVPPQQGLKWISDSSQFFFDADVYGLEYAYKNSPPSTNATKLLDVAFTIQLFIERTLLSLISKYSSTNDNICFSGGVALNSKLNQKLIENGYNLFVPPSPTDAGSAIGAALLSLPLDSDDPLFYSPYIAYNVSSKEAELIATYASNKLNFFVQEFPNNEEYLQSAAIDLHDNLVIAWCRGKAEWGPRALGSRSILANPTDYTMKEIINKKIKFREPYRPFAPSVTQHKASEYFDIQGRLDISSPYSYMLSTCSVKQEYKNRLRAITHVDGTARIQAVWEETNPDYFNLLKAYGSYSGLEVLVNTSCNISGEPTISTGIDALRTFMLSGLDALYIENYVIRKDYK